MVLALTWVYLFFFYRYFFFMLVTRRRPPPGQIVFGTLNHATCDVYSSKSVETLIMLQILVPLMCVKHIFFRIYRSVGFEENFK